MKIFRGWSALPVIIILASCPGPDETAAALGEVPDTISEGFRQVSISPEGRVEITADRVETFSKADYTLFYSSSMQEHSPQGELRIEGSADNLQVFGSKDGNAKGNIRVRNIKDNAGLSAETLNWKNKERLLTSDDTVYVESGDGLTVSGSGFKADMARESFSFAENVRGTLEITDNEPEE